MKKFSNKLIAGIVVIILMVALVIVLVFAVERKDMEIEKVPSQILEYNKDMVMDSVSFINLILSTKEVKDMISSGSLNENEMQKWKNYISESLGISFKYPPNYLVVEAEGIRIFEDTLYNRRVEKILNPDSEPWSQIISFSKSVEGGITQNITKWYKENKFGKNADRDVYTSTDFMGTDSVVYMAEGLFIFDGIFLEKGGYLYQFSVQYFNSPESPRNDFYKIISTVDFI